MVRVRQVYFHTLLQEVTILNHMPSYALSVAEAAEHITNTLFHKQA